MTYWSYINKFQKMSIILYDFFISFSFNVKAKHTLFWDSKKWDSNKDIHCGNFYRFKESLIFKFIIFLLVFEFQNEVSHFNRTSTNFKCIYNM